MPSHATPLRRLAAWPLAALLCVAGCDSDPAQPDDDDDDPVSTVPIRVQGASMGPLQQNVLLFEDDAPLAGATVTVNGTPLTESETGLYRGQLLQLLDAGAELRLHVESQGRVVDGVATIPDPPELTMPLSGAYFDRSSDVEFAWTSPGDPDRFWMHLSWSVGTSSSGTSVEVPGSAREGLVSPDEVPAQVDAVRASVTPYNRGTFTGLVDPESDMSVRAVGQDAALELEPPLMIVGGDMGVRYQNVSIYADHDPVVGAAVTVNGVVLGEAGPGYYTGELPTALTAGDELLLRVEAGGRVVEGATTIVDEPVVTSPVDGQQFDPLADLAYSWTATADPDAFELSLAWVKDGTGSSTNVTVAGDDRAGVVSPAAVPDDPESASASVYGFLRGTFTGPAHPDSDLRVRIGGEPVDLAVESLLEIRGGSMSEVFQNLYVYRNDEPVAGAQVSVNGVPLDEPSTGRYYGQLPTALAPGEEIRVRVEAGGQVVEGVATIIEDPVLTTPVGGQLFEPPADVDFSWTSAQDPDSFELQLSWIKNGIGSARAVSVAGDIRAGVVGTTGLPADPESIDAVVSGFLRGVFSGPAHPDSDMRVRIGGGAVGLTLPPPPQ